MNDFMNIFVEFGHMKEMEPSSEEVQLQVKKLQDYITEHFYNCSTQILSSLGKMYSEGGEFTENIDKAGGTGTAEFTDKYLQKVSTGKERVDSKPKDVDNSGDSKKNGGKSSAKSIWKNFLQKVKAVWDFGQKKFAGKSSTEKYMIAGGCVALVILIFSLIVLLIRRRR